jgi:hypothetical protein
MSGSPAISSGVTQRDSEIESASARVNPVVSIAVSPTPATKNRSLRSRDGVKPPVVAARLNVYFAFLTGDRRLPS